MPVGKVVLAAVPPVEAEPDLGFGGEAEPALGQRAIPRLDDELLRQPTCPIERLGERELHVRKLRVVRRPQLQRGREKAPGGRKSTQREGSLAGRAKRVPGPLGEVVRVLTRRAGELERA